MKPIRLIFLALLPATAAVLISGCTVGPNYQRPAALAGPGAPALPTAYKEIPPPNPPNGTWKPAQPSDAALRGKWWEIYNDPQLTGLEDKVAVSNQTLKAAYEQYLQARDQVRIARANYYPTVSAGPSVSRQKTSANQPSIAVGRTYSAYAIEGQVSWEPDLWGQIRRTVEQARANAQASAADLANVELSLRSELAEDYFELLGLDTQKRLLDNTVTADTDFLKLTQVRFKGGVATDVDVAQAETQLETVRAQDIDVGVARAQFEHAIATLIGTPASSFSLSFTPLDLPLPTIPSGVPSELLERRPDIAGAERRTDAANAQIGIAISAYYPNVQLGGAGGFSSDMAGTWVQGPSSLWSLGGSAVELLFDAGRRHAITDQAREAYEGQTANYRQSVLNAFQEVEDNLAALRILQDESVTQAAAVNSARRSLQISTNRYKGGVTTYLEVLTAQTTQLADERTQADITTRQFAASVQLIKALGGGWDTSQLPKFN
ncbi:NodT family efflux transporter outer membrane factor (OMF) lipoprotein [Silvibacterium bohemicum]|uniref:NodT family efflux transporter outer membrane factor (OMF) lipoprotein n=1 Tax=Silvibacterium bohemicum TaxID=1577686 RepID=A0A841K0F0_9BACT|nr:efflux transporter outer membrane subunit [Silvibacterium bohemicum]MBB6146880.1 NodT family efflux transporter outer membrane factor (OMF) lipoprotein [Silvibacterium bohemicum]